MIKIILLLLAIICSPSITYGQGLTDFKTELKKLADDLTQQLRLKGNSRIAVAPFTDQQNNVTELGKYLSQQFSVYLIRNGLDVLDRSRIDILMDENKMSAKGLLDPKNQATLGRLSGIELIIVGTTTPSDKSIELVVTAIDIARGNGIAGTDGSITRTNSLNDLMRSTVRPGLSSGSSQETSTVNYNVGGQSVGYILMGDKSLELPKESCNQNNRNSGLVDNYGQVCFENILKKPLVLYYISGITTHVYYHPNTLIGVNARNCAPLLYTDRFDGRVHNATYEFYFHTNEEDEYSRLYGKFSVEVEGCQVKTRVINTDRLFLSKTKPN